MLIARSGSHASSHAEERAGASQIMPAFGKCDLRGFLCLPCSCGFLLWPPLSMAKELEGCWEKPHFRHRETGGHEEQSRATSQNLMDQRGTRAGGPIANAPCAIMVDMAELAPANCPRRGQKGRSGAGKGCPPHAEHQQAHPQLLGRAVKQSATDGHELSLGPVSSH